MYCKLHPLKLRIYEKVEISTEHHARKCMDIFQNYLKSCQSEEARLGTAAGDEMPAQLPDSGWNPAFPATGCLNLGGSCVSLSSPVCK